MLLPIATALFALQTAADTTRQPVELDPAVIASAYLDADARDLVHRARERREVVDRSIREYQVLAKDRIALGTRILHRDRQLLISETAARVHWKREGPGRIELLGAREATPMFAGRVRVPDGLKSRGVGLAFDPTDANLLVTAFSDDESSIRHPLAPGSEADYQFRSGDTTRVRLADGRTLRLLELQVIPRRKEFHLASGSLWLDADTDALVRAVVRPARRWDIELDGDADDEDIPGWVKPIRAEVRYITLEYGLWEMRWWLPRLIAFEAMAEVGMLGGMSGTVRYERAYSAYRVSGYEPTAATSVAAAEEPVLTRCPKDTPLACQCRDGRCRTFEVQVPADTASLLDTPHLPPTIFTQGPALMTEDELREITEQLRKLEPPIWQLERPTLSWSVARPDLLRYNRVEALSVGGRVEAEFGPLSADATARLGIGDLQPNAEIGIVRERITARHRIAAYRRLDTVDPATRALGLGNSLTALLLGRDDGDYFRALGVEVIGSPPRLQPQHYRWRLFAERQTEARKHTDFSLPHLIDGARDFRPNIEAEAANQIGGEITLRTFRGLDPTGLRWGAEAGVEGATGTFTFVRPMLSLHGAAPLLPGYLGSLEVAGGTSFGDVPTQSLWHLGGPATVRGYGGNAARGDTFWRARGEVSHARPLARLVLFSDAGWAGTRDALTLDASLLSAGVGASFLDGLVRVDLARALRGETGWRVEMYLGAGL